MTDPHEVISAFLDDEPFDPRELTTALSDPSGRALLVDLVALRHIVQPDDAVPARIVTIQKRSAIRAFMAAAAVFVALVGGYVIGQSRSSAAVSQAPAPTRVVQGPAVWQTPPPLGSAAQ